MNQEKPKRGPKRTVPLVKVLEVLRALASAYPKDEGFAPSDVLRHLGDVVTRDRATKWLKELVEMGEAHQPLPGLYLPGPEPEDDKALLVVLRSRAEVRAVEDFLAIWRRGSGGSAASPTS